MTRISALLASYPRTHPPLPLGNARIYLEEYKINRGGSARRLYRFTACLESWMHRQIAACDAGTVLLDVGAGTLNHRRYEVKASTYDVVEPLRELYDGSPDLERIDHVYPTIQDIPAMPGYDRIFSIAVLEHVEDLPGVVAACAERLANGGVFQAGIPAEGGLAWGLAWRATTGISYRLRTGQPYAPVMRHEHINDAIEIISIVRHFFADVRVHWFPLPVRHLAFYGYIEARRPYLDRCAQVPR
jgi:SAM-dependent methyltransferase